MLLYIIIVGLLFIIYNQNQTQENQKLIINNQQTLWLMMSNIKAAIEEWYHDDPLETITIDDIVEDSKGE